MGPQSHVFCECNRRVFMCVVIIVVVIFMKMCGLSSGSGRVVCPHVKMLALVLKPCCLSSG